MGRSNYSKNTAAAPTCVDLFSGAGGLTLGFVQAGGVPVAAVDHDADSTKTYRRMFPMAREIYCGEIETWQPGSELVGVDVIVGGPPCQGFSLARGLRFVDDPRNHLYKHFVRLVKQMKPSWIVIENVPGITNIGDGVILRQVYEDFEEIGYQLDHRVVNMADYGVPQSRQRAIFVGNRLGVKFQWPKETHAPVSKLKGQLFNDHKPYVSVGQSLGDLPWPMGNYFSHRANSQMRGPRNRSVTVDPAFTLRVRGDEFAMCESPASSAFVPGPLPEVSFSYRPSSNEYQEAMREEPPAWIKTFTKPPTVLEPVPPLKGTRRIAAREQARLQGFPDWFEFEGRAYSQSRQIGNAVPPVFARQLFAVILEQLRKPESSERRRSKRQEVGLELREVVSL